MLELKSEFLCELEGELDDPQEIGATPHGIRMIYPVVGGTVKGPKLNGEDLAFGADWILMRTDGFGELDVSAPVRTDDGELIYAYDRGILKISPELLEKAQKGEEVDPSQYYFRTTPVFETGSDKYSWLNEIICVGIGKIEPKRVRSRIYQIV